MKDIRWDFINNDISVEQTDTGGDFLIAATCSRQNARLIFLKSAVSIFQPQFGVAAEERVYNMSDGEVQKLADRAKTQIRDDGATQVTINYRRNENGLYEFEIGAKYQGE